MRTPLGRRALAVVPVVAALARVLHGGQASAEELGVRGGVSPMQSKGRFSIVVENDLFSFGVGDGTDRFYSNGIFLHSEWSSPWLDDLTKELRAFDLRAARERAYLGVGLSHELHTPQTINPCGALSGDPLATAADPRGTPPGECAAAEQDWAANYAGRDRPFSAVWSLFVTAQRYFHAGRSRGAFSQARLWSRADGGGYGAGAGKGFEVQKNWHGFFNDALLAKGQDPASTPVGWKLGTNPDDARLLVQLSGGADVNLYRLAAITAVGPVGVEAEGRSHARLGAPRNDVGAGFGVRAGILPEHALCPVTPPGENQTSALYLEASAGASLVVTDATNGDFSRYRHFLDDYSVGLRGKLMGVALSASLNWQTILYRAPLALYPSVMPIPDRYHRYGRVGIEFTY